MNLPDAFRTQATTCVGLGSPFMGRLLTLLADIWPATPALARFCDGFTGDIGASGASLPLRLAGGLHALVLTGQDSALKAAYPPHTATDPALEHAVRQALTTHEAFLLDWMTSPPQTNEVRRAAAIIPVAHALAARFARPFVVSELGASGGLNLMWDRFALQVDNTRLGPAEAALTLRPEWTGPVPAPATVQVADRRGVDLNPLHPGTPADALRLSAYLWPDQPERLALTRAAIATFDAHVDAGDAADWLEQRLTQAPKDHLHLIYHTIAWQYFPPETDARARALIEAAGARATSSSPLAWLQFEADDASPGAGLTLRLWPGGLHIPLGRADFHGRWLRWEAPTTF